MVISLHVSPYQCLPFDLLSVSPAYSDDPVVYPTYHDPVYHQWPSPSHYPQPNSCNFPINANVASSFFSTPPSLLSSQYHTPIPNPKPSITNPSVVNHPPPHPPNLYLAFGIPPSLSSTNFIYMGIRIRRKSSQPEPAKKKPFCASDDDRQG